MSEVSPPSNTTDGSCASLTSVTMSTDSITRARTPGYKKKGAIHLKPNSYDTEDRQAGRQMVMVMMVMMVTVMVIVMVTVMVLVIVIVMTVMVLLSPPS